MNVIFGDPHLRKLAFTAVGLGGACVLFIDYMYLSTSCDHLKSPYCQKPYNLLLDHEKGCQLLGGKPIVLKTLNLDNVSITEQVAKLQLRVKGNRRKGTIHTKSTKDLLTNDWVLDYAVMRVESSKNSWNVWLHPSITEESNPSLETLESNLPTINELKD